ncbi:MAG: hypothetical protein O7I42_14565 [Alphaproteobacteria bacterium]|nr:hypothetical protein [Alphaproteobacteria bacterium]
MPIDAIGAAAQFRPAPARGSGDPQSIDDALRQHKEANQSNEASRTEDGEPPLQAAQVKEDSETGDSEKSGPGSNPGSGIGLRLDLSI